jgi:hypothetical protein
LAGGLQAANKTLARLVGGTESFGAAQRITSTPHIRHQFWQKCGVSNQTSNGQTGQSGGLKGQKHEED